MQTNVCNKSYADTILERTAISIAGGGFRFLLLTFQYLVGWGIINLVISINLLRFVYFVSQRLMRLWRKSYQCGSPFLQKRERDLVPLLHNGTDLAAIR
jgi:hypothetical protein